MTLYSKRCFNFKIIDVPMNRDLVLLFLICASTLPVYQGYPQVINDNIEQRLYLHPENTLRSNTVNCTVQWDCVDESLTGRCIKYHNDQWFSFQVPTPGPYYINISNQRCRDLYGVQIVIIDGVPCDVKSYQILTCYSTGTQDDIFIALPELNTSRHFLVNIDGYLHDFCSFDITLSKIPSGLPVEKMSETTVSKSDKQDSVLLEWHIPDSLVGTINGFEIWKRLQTDSRHSLSENISVHRNALGRSPTHYVHRDLRVPGQTTSYKIVGVTPESKFLFDEVTVRYDTIIVNNAPENSLQVNLDYKKGTPLTILVINRDNDAVLQNSQVIFDRKKHAQITFYVGNLIEQGIRNFRVEITNNTNRQKQVLTFRK